MKKQQQRNASSSSRGTSKTAHPMETKPKTVQEGKNEEDEIAYSDSEDYEDEDDSGSEAEEDDAVCSRCQAEVPDGGLIAVNHKGEAMRAGDIALHMQPECLDTICVPCYIESKFVACGVCDLMFRGDELMHLCEDCEQYICSKTCVGVMGRYTRECICIDCFDGRCAGCGGELEVADDDLPFFWDVAENVPYCDKCQYGAVDEDGDEDVEEVDSKNGAEVPELKEEGEITVANDDENEEESEEEEEEEEDQEDGGNEEEEDDADMYMSLPVKKRQRRA